MNETNFIYKLGTLVESKESILTDDYALGYIAKRYIDKFDCRKYVIKWIKGNKYINKETTITEFQFKYHETHENMLTTKTEIDFYYNYRIILKVEHLKKVN